MGAASHRRHPPAGGIRRDRSGGEPRRAELLQSGATFQLFPADRLFLSGEPSSLDRAIDYLAMVDSARQQEDQEHFAVEEVRVDLLLGWAGRSLAVLELPARFGVTVLAVARDHEQLSAPDPQRPLSEHDRLVLAGTAEDLQRLRTAVVPQGDSQPIRP